MWDRKEREIQNTQIHKFYFGICQAGELAGFEVVGRKHKSPQTVIVASACTHPECSHCIEMDNAQHYTMHSPIARCKMHTTQNIKMHLIA